MEVIDLFLRGLKLIVPRIFKDQRGLFFEAYRQSEYLAQGIDATFVQDNISVSHQNTIRALHFQASPGQDKLVMCLQGRIWDVAVDLRFHSPTFKKWLAVVLDEKKANQLFIPKGFAHGFCVLSPFAKVQYKVSSFYDLKEERSIRWNDPDLSIDWPIKNPVLSERDETSPFFKEIQLC